MLLNLLLICLKSVEQIHTYLLLLHPFPVFITQAIMDVYKPIFAAKGIDIFVSHKQEYISHGQHGGHVEHYRWIEFVDRAVQPSYQPQRDANTKDEGCTVM